MNEFQFESRRDFEVRAYADEMSLPSGIGGWKQKRENIMPNESVERVHDGRPMSIEANGGFPSLRKIVHEAFQHTSPFGSKIPERHYELILHRFHVRDRDCSTRYHLQKMFVIRELHRCSPPTGWMWFGEVSI